MPRYFFHTRDGDTCDVDDEGTDLPDDRSAREAAKELVAALNTEKLPDGDHISISVTVERGDGTEIYVATLSLDAR